MNGNVDNLRIRILKGLNLRDAFHLVHQIFIIRFVRPVSVSGKVNEPFFDQQGAPPKLARFRPALLFWSPLSSLITSSKRGGHSWRLHVCLVVF